MSSITDPIGDLLTRIRNAQMCGKKSCKAPHSSLKLKLLDLLKKEGWIESVEVVGDIPKKEIIVTFSEDKNNLELKRVSKPGRRIYAGKKKIKPVLQGYGIAVVTTSEGLMTDAEARKKGIGGEVICTIS